MSVIAHLSDPHLDGSVERELRLRAVLDAALSLPELHALVISGDLADHGEAQEYQALLAALPDAVPTLAVPGNHDLGGAMCAAFAAHGRPATLNGVLDLPGLRLLGLDSHVDREDPGVLSKEALAYARTALETSRTPVLIVLHHPPVAIGHHVVDTMGLSNADELSALIEGSGAVIGVLTGHVHGALAASFAGVPVLGAPGIASRLRLGSKDDPIADPAALPGLAIHKFEGHALSTVFHTLSPAEAEGAGLFADSRPVDEAR